MFKIQSFSISRNIFFHACIPPLIIFTVLAVALWGGGDAMNFPLTLAIFITGAGGGVISTYFRLKNVAPTKAQSNAVLQVYVTPIISGLLGFICYAFFLTEMLRGPLFPEFVNKTSDYTGLQSVFEIQPKHALDAAKALLWSFVAGFSEKMIPNILDKLASQGERESDSASPLESNSKNNTSPQP